MVGLCSGFENKMARIHIRCADGVATVARADLEGASSLLADIVSGVSEEETADALLPWEDEELENVQAFLRLCATSGNVSGEEQGPLFIRSLGLLYKWDCQGLVQTFHSVVHRHVDMDVVFDMIIAFEHLPCDMTRDYMWPPRVLGRLHAHCTPEQTRRLREETRAAMQYCHHIHNFWDPSETAFHWDNDRKFAHIFDKSAKEKKIEIWLAEPEKAPGYLWMPFELYSLMNRSQMEVAVSDPRMGALFEALDEACVDFATRDSVKCFGKEMNADAVRDRFVRPYRPLTEMGRSNLLRLSADRVNVFRFLDFNEETGKLRLGKGSVGLLTRGCRVAPRVEVNPLWFVDGDKQLFGYSLQVSDIIVDTSSSKGESKMPFIMKEGIKLVSDE